MHKQHDANMVWYAGCDMWCIGMIWKGMIEPGLNMEIQECHWKGELISVEIDIKITGIGCTIWKWQAKQKWHRSAINSMRPSKCIKNNMLQHPNIATKYMTGIHSRCLTKDEHWATANSLNSRFKQAWQKCKRYQVTDLVKITTCQEFNMRKQCLEQDNYMLQEHIMANQGMEWGYSKHKTKVPYWP